ncbi:MAG: hypothetical protein UR60_C0035G0008 [Candidatus Moranbacteria bacterium GW2011_GWF2_34_56]|nr:MAG: hypothetical protein UR51_C0007G0020 [Candidatus Moranbacteria bacterium GW2011_GWF1_34_10]KKP63917.1 MAG: hypothetical protein UR60_C0035G0008 [Candidatus Moranbacteria bacterium GW2011_GWF2_34_56]HBI16791.1 hypothetical protein [Candidatus Moranbacteria bacterium]
MKKNKLIPIGKAAKMLGVSVATLQRWHKNGKLIPIISIKGRRQYILEEIEARIPKKSIFSEALVWVSREKGVEPNKEFYCQNSSDLQFRVKKLENQLSEIENIKDVYSLIVAAVGEIGNNSFDHNLGNWPDIPGIFFGVNLLKRQIVLADRGQGIFKTLKRVKPELENDEQALETAFTEIISGRAPEERGNGLKFVKRIVPLAHIELFFQTGTATLNLTDKDSSIIVNSGKIKFRGCLALVNF